MEEIKGIVLSSDELLAAMVYYFSEIDPIDYTLLSDYVVGELKKKYPDQTIRIEGQKDCYSSIFEFYDHGNNNYEQIFCISDKKRRDKLFWDSRDGKSVWLLKYDKDDKYIDAVNEMYDDNILDDDDIEELNLSKEKDDFER